MSSSESSRRRHWKKHCHHQRHSHRSPSRESSQLPSLFEALRQEITDSHVTLANELGRISSRVAVIEGQSLSAVRTSTTTQEQSLPTTQSVPSSKTEQSFPGGKEQQSLLTVEDHDTADRAEPQNVDTSREETDPASRGWDERDDVPDYNKQVFWQPDSELKMGTQGQSRPPQPK